MHHRWARQDIRIDGLSGWRFQVFQLPLAYVALCGHFPAGGFRVVAKNPPMDLKQAWREAHGGGRLCRSHNDAEEILVTCCFYCSLGGASASPLHHASAQRRAKKQSAQTRALSRHSNVLPGTARQRNRALPVRLRQPPLCMCSRILAPMVSMRANCFESASRTIAF